MNCSLLTEAIRLATSEEQAIAAIDAAEQLAIANVQLLRQMKKLIPKPFDVLTEAAVQTQTAGIRGVAEIERKIVRKVSAAARKSRKNLSKALREANARLRKKNGQLKKGKTQADVMRLAQRLKKKM